MPAGGGEGEANADQRGDSDLPIILWNPPPEWGVSIAMVSYGTVSYGAALQAALQSRAGRPGSGQAEYRNTNKNCGAVSL